MTARLDALHLPQGDRIGRALLARHAQPAFIRKAGEHREAAQALLRQLVADRRFDTISAEGLRELVREINRWLPKPQIEELPSYLGENPAATLAEWRRLVRESAPRWQ